LKGLRISLAQINPVVGDLAGNVRKIIAYIKKAKKLESDVVAFPELALTGYPPEDLLLKPQFIKDNIKALHKIKDETKGILAVVGFVSSDKGLYNSAAIISDGRVIDIYNKHHLPNYGVFDEYRYFLPGSRFPVYSLGGIRFGVNICEDIWHKDGPARVQALLGAVVIININASPYRMGKVSFREEIVLERISECGIPIAYVNMIGGQDELVFDGGSFVSDKKGNLLAKAKHFNEDFITIDMMVEKAGEDVSSGNAEKELKKLLSGGRSADVVKIVSARKKRRRPVIRAKKIVVMSKSEKVYKALLLGTKDYVQKNGFKDVIIGVSGGVDSALVTTIAVDALGKERVHGIFMPSQYTSKESHEDVEAHAGNLGIKILTIPIENIYKSFINTLSESFMGTDADTTEENLQARIRGNILMAFSNKFGWLVLTTGNKSEMSVGYATLYGDMAGGFAVIKDVPKTLVYELCSWRNEKEGRALIPERILWKEPTAELRPDQKDTDSLPPYPVLDPILKAYVEEDCSFEELMNMGCDLECTRKVVKMVDRSEYKRRQAPPGIKITPRAFGKDRRFPITNRYRSY
jgi:NAD+ synthase (glutamine-hydrolysing)